MRMNYQLLSLVLGCVLGVVTGCQEATSGRIGSPAVRSEEGALPSPQHLVLISIDTLRADHVGAYGSTVRTPHIDALAADGVRFSRAWPAATTTLASHTSMLTGQLPHSHGVPLNGVIVDPQNTTLAEVLQAQGFATIGVVGGTPMRASTGLGQGFDDYIGPQRPGSRGNQTMLAAIDARPQERLFLFMHYWDAHWPYIAPEPWSRMYRTDDLPLRGTLDEIRALRRALSAGEPEAEASSAAMKGAYAGVVSYTDAHVGDFIAALKARDLYDDALIILTSDHGESTDEHWDHWTHGKSTYESAVHVPLIIKLPDSTSAGRVIDTPVSLIDLFPTALALLDVPVAASVDGVSLAAALAGQPLSRGPIFVEATAPDRSDKINGEYWINQENCAAILSGSDKLQHCPWRKNSIERFDLSTDPAESHSRSDAADTDALHAQLQAARSRVTPRRIVSEEGTDMAAALQALGYVE